MKANKLLSWHRFSTLRVPNSLSQFGSRSPVKASKSLQPPALAQHLDNVEVKEEASSDQGMLGYIKPEVVAGSPLMPSISCPPPNADDQHLIVNGSEYDEQAYASNVIDNRLHEAVSPQADETFTFDDLDLDQLELQLTPPEADLASKVASTTDHQQDDHTDNREVSRPEVSAAGLHSNAPPSTTTLGMILDESGKCLEVDPARTGTSSSALVNRHPTLVELSVPWNRLNSSVQPGFVEKFYQSSRLHHLSTWKAKLRDITAEIQKDRPSTPSNSKRRTIM